jgi:hypothetical protein
MRSRLRRTRSRPLLLYIYLAPPGRHLLVESDELRLGSGPRENNARPALDPLFRSTGLCCGPRAIGSILAATLGDGAAGLSASSAVASPWCKTRAMPPLVGFQTGQCCRGHFRKPRVETLTEIHRQPYSITRPLRRALMSAWGQTEKNSVRAYVFRFALKLGHCSMHSACLKGAHELT